MNLEGQPSGLHCRICFREGLGFLVQLRDVRAVDQIPRGGNALSLLHGEIVPSAFVLGQTTACLGQLLRRFRGGLLGDLLDLVDAQQLVEDEPGVRGALADPAIVDQRRAAANPRQVEVAAFADLAGTLTRTSDYQGRRPRSRSSVSATRAPARARDTRIRP